MVMSAQKVSLNNHDKNRHICNPFRNIFQRFFHSFRATLESGMYSLLADAVSQNKSMALLRHAL
jgi:hypothetical protein